MPAMFDPLAIAMCQHGEHIAILETLVVSWWITSPTGYTGSSLVSLPTWSYIVTTSNYSKSELIANPYFSVDQLHNLVQKCKAIKGEYLTTRSVVFADMGRSFCDSAYQVLHRGGVVESALLKAHSVVADRMGKLLIRDRTFAPQYRFAIGQDDLSERCKTMFAALDFCFRPVRGINEARSNWNAFSIIVGVDTGYTLVQNAELLFVQLSATEPPCFVEKLVDVVGRAEQHKSTRDLNTFLGYLTKLPPPSPTIPA